MLRNKANQATNQKANQGSDWEDNQGDKKKDPIKLPPLQQIQGFCSSSGANRRNK